VKESRPFVVAAGQVGVEACCFISDSMTAAFAGLVGCSAWGRGASLDDAEVLADADVST
jgi:hypothetical protein